jgi:hypothetical protein
MKKINGTVRKRKKKNKDVIIQSICFIEKTKRILRIVLDKCLFHE